MVGFHRPLTKGRKIHVQIHFDNRFCRLCACAAYIAGTSNVLYPGRDTEMSKMTDTTKKEGAMKEMAMAKEMMAKKDDGACVTHMTNAQKMMPGM
jgi:hypothetical protein